MKTNGDHVVFKDNAFRCLHCGAFEPVEFPVDVMVFVKASKRFLKPHRSCKPSVTVSERNLQILRHSLGLDYEGRGRQYRNHFCAGGKDLQSCEELVASGHMVRLHVNALLTGGDPAFGVTEMGKAEAIKGVKPLSRSKRRYLAYVRSNCDMSFGEWLKGGFCRE